MSDFNERNIEAERIQRAQRERAPNEQRRMARRDWTIVLGAVALIVAIFGFIYFSDTAIEQNETRIEPAAGTTQLDPNTPAPASPDYGFRENPGVPKSGPQQRPAP